MRTRHSAHLLLALLISTWVGIAAPAAAHTSASATQVPSHASVAAVAVSLGKSAAATHRAPAQVRVAHTATLSTLQAKIDSCRGPVFTKYRTYPGLIAEHDYCGGTYRLGRHAIGAQVRVTGPGVRNGLYRVVARKVVRKGSPFSVLNGMGHVVLQTCAGNSLRLVGMVRVGR